MTTSIVILIAGVIALTFLGILGLKHMTYRQEEKQRLYELKKESQRTISPLRMRAYERLALLMERTEPEAMLKEIMAEENWTQLSIVELQRDLLQRLRLEYDHNLSQQVYVSDQVWQKILIARDQMGAYINQMALRQRPNSTPMDYIKTLIQTYHMNGDTPNEIALQAINDEAHSLL